MRRLLKNEQGSMPFLTLFITLAMVMLLSYILFFATVQVNCINIRNAFKMELNNISASIYADTFHSQREANLLSYMRDVHISSEYLEELEEGFIDGVKERIELTTEDYTISDIAVDYNKDDDKIIYRARCKVEFQVQMFGNIFPPVTEEIALTGTHNTKY